jgi:hypothetical protein
VGKNDHANELEYETPKIVDLQIEQKNAQGGEGCAIGSGEVGCAGGMADAPPGCLDGAGG